MIRLGQRVEILTASKINRRYNLRVMSSAKVVYHYWRMGFPVGEDPIQASFGLGQQSVVVPDHYFKIEPDTNAPSNYKETKRAVAYVVDTFDIKLLLFVFPMMLAKDMQKQAAGKSVKDFDWSITKTGVGINTRYKAEKLKQTKIFDAETKIILDTIESNSIKSILVDSKRIYTQVKFTEFDRFEIMDFGDE